MIRVRDNRTRLIPDHGSAPAANCSAKPATTHHHSGQLQGGPVYGPNCHHVRKHQRPRVPARVEVSWCQPQVGRGCRCGCTTEAWRLLPRGPAASVWDGPCMLKLPVCVRLRSSQPLCWCTLRCGGYPRAPSRWACGCVPLANATCGRTAVAAWAPSPQLPPCHCKHMV